MFYSINNEKFKNTFSVPDAIVDKHLRIASGEQIKVLLLLLRKAPDKLDEAKIAKTLRFDVSDVEDYLQYWINTGILNEGEESEAPAKKEEKKAAEPVKYVPGASVKKAEDISSIEEKPAVTFSRPSSSEIATRMEESRELCNLFNEIQQKLGKTVGYDGQCTFLLLHDHYGLPVDVIFMVVDYCVSIGKTGYSYIEQVGKSWAEKEIDTIEKAAEKIAALSSAESFWKKFAPAVGIATPKPTSKQIEFIESWTGPLNMSLEMIIKAYEKMAEKTGKISFSYINKILVDWNSKGYLTIQDVDNADAAVSDAAKKAVAKPSNKTGSDASYDLEKFTNKSITGKLKYERKSRY